MEKEIQETKKSVDDFFKATDKFIDNPGQLMPILEDVGVILSMTSEILLDLDKQEAVAALIKDNSKNLKTINDTYHEFTIAVVDALAILNKLDNFNPKWKTAKFKRSFLFTGISLKSKIKSLFRKIRLGVS